MPKLPGVADLRPRAAPQATGSDPSLKALREQAGENSWRAERAAAQQPLQPVIALGEAVVSELQKREIEEQRREDAIARSAARVGFFTEADKLASEAEAAGLHDRATFDKLNADLAGLRERTLAGFKGSADARSTLEVQLNEAGADYAIRAHGARRTAVKQRLGAEVGSAANRLTSHVYSNPSRLADMLTAGDALLEDMRPAMSADEFADHRAVMRGTIAGGAVDGLLNSGRWQEAQQVIGALPPDTFSPTQRSGFDRRIRAAEADALAGVTEASRKLETFRMINGRDPTPEERLMLSGTYRAPEKPAGPEAPRYNHYDVGRERVFTRWDPATGQEVEVGRTEKPLSLEEQLGGILGGGAAPAPAPQQPAAPKTGGKLSDLFR